jgi:hypothetical protein
MRGHVTGKEVNLSPRHHHLAEAALTGGEDIVHDPALFVAKSGRAAHHGADLLICHLFAGDLRVATQNAHQNVGGDTKQPDQRPCSAGGENHQRRQRESDRFRTLQGKALRGQLADHDRDVGDHDGDQHQRDCAGNTGAKAQPLQQRRQIVRQPGRSEGSGKETRQGDPDLDRRKKEVRICGQLRNPLPTLAAVGNLSDLAITE